MPNDPKRHVNARDVPEDIDTSPDGNAYVKRKRLGRAVGADMLGCGLIEMYADKGTWPYHYHEGNEEAMYVLEGAGRIRTPDGEFDLEPGDYISFPEGPAGGHKVVAVTQSPLRFLSFSTMQHPDITVYPDSGKVGLYAGTAPGGPPERSRTKAYLRQDATIPYWDGEA